MLPLSGVRAAMPADTPTVSPAQRAKQVAQRQRLLQARFKGADPARPEILRRLAAIQKLLGHKVSGQTVAKTGL